MNLKNRRQSFHALQLRVFLASFTPALAWAAGEQLVQAQRGSLDSVSGWVALALTFFSVLGWMISDLDKAAELWKPRESPYETWKIRLTLWKGIAASCAAGFSVYVIGKFSPDFLLSAFSLKTATGVALELPELVLFMFVSVAGFMGARWFAWFERKMTT